MQKPRIDDRDWSKLSFGQHVYQLEVEGYTVYPDLLGPEHLDRLRAQGRAAGDLRRRLQCASTGAPARAVRGRRNHRSDRPFPDG